MAVNWIPVREDLATVREVLAIARRTNQSRQWVVGALVQFWGWAQKETANGDLVDVDVDACVDTLALPKNFFDALIAVGWLTKLDHPTIGLRIVNFDVWLSKGAKARLSKAKRQQDWRNNKKDVDACVDATVDASLSTPVLFCSVLSFLKSKINSHSKSVPTSELREHLIKEGAATAEQVDAFIALWEMGDKITAVDITILEHFSHLTEEIQSDNRFINTGRRPLAKYPEIWLSPVEIGEVLERAKDCGLKDIKGLFSIVQMALRDPRPSYGKPNAGVWLQGWALTQMLEQQRRAGGNGAGDATALDLGPAPKGPNDELPDFIQQEFEAVGKRETVPNVWLTPGEEVALQTEFGEDAVNAASVKLSRWSNDTSLTKAGDPYWQSYRRKRDHASLIRDKIREAANGNG